MHNGVNAYIATLDDKTMPPNLRYCSINPRRGRPSRFARDRQTILADALSNTWQMDLVRGSGFQNVPKDKLADLTNPVTPNDVVLYGKDTRPAAEPSGSWQSSQVSIIGPILASAH